MCFSPSSSSNIADTRLLELAEVSCRQRDLRELEEERINDVVLNLLTLNRVATVHSSIERLSSPPIESPSSSLSALSSSSSSSSPDPISEIEGADDEISEKTVILFKTIILDLPENEANKEVFKLLKSIVPFIGMRDLPIKNNLSVILNLFKIKPILLDIYFTLKKDYETLITYPKNKAKNEKNPKVFKKILEIILSVQEYSNEFCSDETKETIKDLLSALDSRFPNEILMKRRKQQESSTEVIQFKEHHFTSSTLVTASRSRKLYTERGTKITSYWEGCSIDEKQQIVNEIKKVIYLFPLPQGEESEAKNVKKAIESLKSIFKKVQKKDDSQRWFLNTEIPLLSVLNFKDCSHLQSVFKEIISLLNNNPLDDLDNIFTYSPSCSFKKILELLSEKSSLFKVEDISKLKLLLETIDLKLSPKEALENLKKINALPSLAGKRKEREEEENDSENTIMS